MRPNQIRSPSSASAGSSLAKLDESSHRLVGAEELIRKLEGQNEELKLGRYAAQRTADEEKSVFYAREQDVFAAEQELQ